MALARATSPAVDRRQAILDAALELFDEQGFHGATVPAIAERARVGAGTVYRNFESKDDLVNELYRLWKRRFAAELLADWPEGASPRAVLAHVWRRFCEFAQAHPRALSFTELHHHGAYLDGESQALRDQFHARFVALVEAMQAQRALRADVDAAVLIAVVEGVFVRLRREAGCGRLELRPEHLEQAERCVWEAIRA